MEEKISLESEGKAIQDISKILKPLDIASKKNVVEYVFKSLGLNQHLDHSNDTTPEKSSVSNSIFAQQNEPLTKVMDIRSFAIQKKPKTTVQKIALVGFYLSEIAKEDEKAEQFRVNDIEKYFKQAGFKLPANVSVELSRTKDAGYIEKTQKGKYKLNPVGYNLIAYTLPDQSNSKKNKSHKKMTKKPGKKKLRLKRKSKS